MLIAVVRVSISASPIFSETFRDGGSSTVVKAARNEARIFPRREANCIWSRMSTILACMPTENWCTKTRPLALATSTGLILPDAKAATAASSDKGIPSPRANRFIVPAGRIASAFFLPIRAAAAAEIVPSPPPAKRTSAWLAAALVSAVSISFPGTRSMSTRWPAFSSVCAILLLNASRSVVRSVPPSRFKTAMKRMNSRSSEA